MQTKRSSISCIKKFFCRQIANEVQPKIKIKLYLYIMYSREYKRQIDVDETRMTQLRLSCCNKVARKKKFNEISRRTSRQIRMKRGKASNKKTEIYVCLNKEHCERATRKCYKFSRVFFHLLFLT